MIHLTEEMRDAINNALADGTPVVVATASPDGRPDLAFKGSVLVWDPEHLAYWERSRGETLRNLEANPHICLLYRNPQRGLAWRFYGIAELHPDGDLRARIMERVVPAELERDPERKGVAVLIRVDRVLRGRDVIMAREE